MWRFEASPRRAAPKGLPSSFAQHRIPKGTYLHPTPLFLRSWHTDITYLKTGEGWLYLATVIDLATRMVTGWQLASHMRTSLVTDALAMAIGHGHLAPGAVFHSDRGAQYTSAEFTRFCEAHGVRTSVGRTGVCWDNAAAESFFAALKNEMYHRQAFPSRARARFAVADYIEVFCNRQRLHSTLGYRTPAEVLTELQNAATAA
jgi:putative transposase